MALVLAGRLAISLYDLLGIAGTSVVTRLVVTDIGSSLVNTITLGGLVPGTASAALLANVLSYASTVCIVGVGVASGPTGMAVTALYLVVRSYTSSAVTVLKMTGTGLSTTYSALSKLAPTSINGSTVATAAANESVELQELQPVASSHEKFGESLTNNASSSASASSSTAASSSLSSAAYAMPSPGVMALVLSSLSWNKDAVQALDSGPTTACASDVGVPFPATKSGDDIADWVVVDGEGHASAGGHTECTSKAVSELFGSMQQSLMDSSCLIEKVSLNDLGRETELSEILQDFERNDVSWHDALGGDEPDDMLCLHSS
eukprot:TRINITY_DN3930_c2_g3_i2.p1 TRINITY_DN3930_c2_g3~~TRINITY_DN3930_c2_g3_i2.p1  ORF type:complete len:320 (+),score=48.45 TRINITY_DN3930_c2_g3_i2:165-1124(+)